MNFRARWITIAVLLSIGGQTASGCKKRKAESRTKASEESRGVIGLAKNYIPDYQCDGLGTAESEWQYFPKFGTTRVRNTHPSDFSWGYELEFKRFINATIESKSNNK